MTAHPFIPAPPQQIGGSATLPAILDALPPDAAYPAQTQFTRPRQAAFLRLLADSGEVRVAARASNVSHQTVYRMRRACATFRRGWDAALIVARERAEEELATRAMHGVEEEVYYHGEVVATRRRFDSRLLLAHLARLDRMAQRAEVAGLADHFDAVLQAFEGHGPKTHEAAPDDAQTPHDPLKPAPFDPDTELGAVVLPSTQPEITPEPCNTRSMSPDNAQTEVPQGDTPQEPAHASHEPTLEQRLSAMEAARPHGALTPAKLAQQWPMGWEVSFDTSGAAFDPPEAGAIEAAQLTAFEAGEARWWLMTDTGELARDDIECDARVPTADHAKLARGAA